MTDRYALKLLGAPLPELPAGFDKKFSRDEGCPQAEDFGDVSKVVPLAIEREFKFKLARNNVVVGRWDRIDERDGGIVLVDYKTSEIEDAPKAEQRARDSLMHDQLGLYALAYAEATGQPPARVEVQP